MRDARRPPLGTCAALLARTMTRRFLRRLSGVCLAGRGGRGCSFAFVRCNCRVVATQVLSGPQKSEISNLKDVYLRPQSSAASSWIRR